MNESLQRRVGNPPLRAPLRRPAFRRLAASYAVNEMGDWLGIVALSVLVYDQTGSALATAALFLGTRFAPALVAPLLVTRSERPAPRFALPVIYGGQAACFCVLALLAENFSLAAVVAIAVIDGSLALTGRAITRSVTATLLEPEGELRAGNAILNVAFTGGAALGPALAGLIVAGFGVQTALLLDAVSFYAVGWLLLTARGLPLADPEPGGMLQRLRSGLAYIGREPVLRGLLAAQSLAFIFFALVLPIEVIYAKETLGAGDTGYGLMLASWGAGMVVAASFSPSPAASACATCSRLSTALIGLAYLGLAAAPTLLVACAASLLGGAGNGVQWVALVSAVQELTSDGCRPASWACSSRSEPRCPASASCSVGSSPRPPTPAPPSSLPASAS